MKIGVLQAGLLPEEMAPRWGEYDSVFTRFLTQADPNLEFQGWRVVEGEFPDAPDVVDGWIISGSKHGVYEDHFWLPPLKDFIRACAGARVPMIGVCFGHQVMAEALGGKAVKSEKGWGLGPHEYVTKDLPGWMSDAPGSIRIEAVHQDQVIALPPDATPVASSAFCENAALLYGDPDHPYAMSIQPHPEMSAEFVEELIATRRGVAFPEALSDAALARNSLPLNNDWAAKWFLDFLRLHKS